MESEFDGLEALLVPQSSRVSKRSVSGDKRPSGEWVDGQFIAGKIPLDWICRACVTKSARTLATVFAIWHRRGLKGMDEDLVLTTATLKRFRVDAAAKSRALKELEELGLIRVTRLGRKNPLVAIIRKVPSTSEDAPQQAA